MEHIGPKKLQLAVKMGFDRVARYRKAQAMFIKAFVGQYYREQFGITGDQPINLYYNVLRATVPNLVMDNPLNKVVTEYIDQKPYAELLSLALDKLEENIEFRDTLRTGIVSAFFGMAVFKVSLKSAGLHLEIDDQRIDPGQVYASLVDLDDFVIDPSCKSLRESSFLGHRVCVPRQTLMEREEFNQDVVRRLPPAGKPGKGKDVADMTRDDHQFRHMQDMVNVVELWVPEAEALVTMPDPREFMCDQHLALEEYYGPPTGPYEFFSMSPEVPGNPLPIAPASVIYDLQDMANRVFKKTMEQSERQKDVLTYNPAFADEARDIEEAQDGQSIAVTDPNQVNVLSFGGQNPANVDYLGQLQMWFNYMAGNPDQLAGIQSDARTATQASILQSNAAVTIEDAKNLVYQSAERCSAKIAWYLHTDPLIEMPLSKRLPGGEVQQVILTPDQRSGDFLDFTFRIVQRSMNRLDPMIRSKRIIEFCTAVIPAAVNTAMMMMQMGRPFNLETYLTRVADEMGVTEWVQDLFHDPEFAERLQMFQMMSPQNAGPGQTSEITNGSILQNHGFANRPSVASGGQMFNQQAQGGANEMQMSMAPSLGQGMM